MKYLFVIVLAILLMSSAFTLSILPDRQSPVPVVYWVTDPCPAREQQIANFHRWLAKDPSRPNCQLRLDAANYDMSKKIIQAVSGIAGDIIDLYGGRETLLLQNMGVLRNVTDDATKMGFDISRTYESISPEISFDGQQYMFPCNVASLLYWINKSTFERYSCTAPQTRMTLEEFEAIGKEFVDTANQPGSHRTVFLCNTIDPQVLIRSLGLSKFNETLTRCTLDDARYIQVLELLHKWTFEDHLMPTPAEASTFAAESGFGGIALQLFNSGNYAMIYMGRYALVQLREFEGLDLAVCEPPHGGYPNTFTTARSASIYVNSPNEQCALHFLQYLASRDYNMQIVRDADALPPNPKYTQCEAFSRPLPLVPDISNFLPYADDERAAAIRTFTEAFYAVTDNLNRNELVTAQETGQLMQFLQQNLPVPPRPRNIDDHTYQEGILRFQHYYLSLIPKYQMEWDCHDIFAQTATTIAISDTYSPFVPAATVAREITLAISKYHAGICTAVEAAEMTCNRINEEIQRTINETQRLQELYTERCATQNHIDKLSETGELIPLELISNIFYRRYYKDQGLAE